MVRPQGKLRANHDLSVTDIHDNNVWPDLLDILVGNAVIRLGVKKIAELVSARYNHLADLAAALVKLQIVNSSKLFAVPQVYDILGLQVRKTHHIFVSFSSIDYYMPEGFGTVISFLQIARLMNIFRLF